MRRPARHTRLLASANKARRRRREGGLVGVRDDDDDSSNNNNFFNCNKNCRSMQQQQCAMCDDLLQSSDVMRGGPRPLPPFSLSKLDLGPQRGGKEEEGGGKERAKMRPQGKSQICLGSPSRSKIHT